MHPLQGVREESSPKVKIREGSQLIIICPGCVSSEEEEAM
jgi:hypothetical protein